MEWLDGDDASLISWLTDAKGSEAKTSSDYEEVVPEVVSDVDDKRLLRVERERDRLVKEVASLRSENSTLKDSMERALEDVPEDRAEIARKMVALHEREEELRIIQESLQDASGVSSSQLRDRYVAELQDKECCFKERETDLLRQVRELDQELEKRKIEEQLREDQIKLAKMSRSEREERLERKAGELQDRVATLLLVEQESIRLRTQLEETEDELEKVKGILSFKEDELNNREEDLLYREKLLSEEARRLEDTKREVSEMSGDLETTKRLEALKAEIESKEKDLMAKERFLNSKREELRLREQGIIEDEISTREEDRALEVSRAKVKTGNRRFDDLLMGGIPFGSNILVHGPPFIGKEVMVDQFMAEGLRKGVPVLWVITDKTASDIRIEMERVISGYEEYEKIGLVRYVDSYSRSMGDTTEDPYTEYVEDPSDHRTIGEAVDRATGTFNAEHDYYRLAFRSVSTLIAYSDPNTAFRFLNPFCGKRKKDRAVAMFTLEKGMHGEQEIQMLGMIMDGMIDFKVDQLKTFFSVKGISEVQSRAFIRYTPSDHGLSIGSFSLDHIK